MTKIDPCSIFTFISNGSAKVHLNDFQSKDSVQCKENGHINNTYTGVHLIVMLKAEFGSDEVYGSDVSYSCMTPKWPWPLIADDFRFMRSIRKRYTRM